MYPALDIAKYIVTKCKRDEKPISNLQLQKILYYIQREYLHFDSLAFPDSIEAWRFGPVVPTVYYYFCGSGAMPLIPFLEFDGTSISNEDKSTIDRIVEAKRELRPWVMVQETHKAGGAWDQTYQAYREGKISRPIIPVELIKMETVG